MKHGQIIPQQSEAKAGKHDYNKILTDQQKARQAVLFLGQYYSNQIGILTSSHTRMLLIGQYHIN